MSASHGDHGMPERDTKAELPNDDELLLQRALDGELRPNEALEFEARLEREPGLRRRLEEARALQAFRSSAQPRGGLGLDFADRLTARVMSDLESESAPQAAESAAAEVEDTLALGQEAIPFRKPAAWLDRAILIAALVLVGLGISFMIDANATKRGEVEANPEIRREVKVLTERYEARLRKQRLERELEENKSRVRGPDARDDADAGK